MNFKFLTVSMLALAVASTIALSGCKREEAADVQVEPQGEEVVVPEEGAMTEEVVTEEAVTDEHAAEGEAVGDEHAAEAPAEEAHH